MFGNENEPVVLKRDVDTLSVPAGIPNRLSKDSLVYITQAMGGSFTVYFEGNLYRVAGRDADALGKEPARLPELRSTILLEPLLQEASNLSKSLIKN